MTTIDIMTPQTAEVTPLFSQSPDQEWQPSMPPTDLIFDDGEPLESNRHRAAMNALIRSYKHHCAGRNNYFVGGNMFVYYSSQQVRNKEFRGPDFLVVLDVPHNPAREGWVVWEENGRYPDMIVELLSDTTEAQDLGGKKTLYEKVFDAHAVRRLLVADSTGQLLGIISFADVAPYLSDLDVGHVVTDIVEKP